MEEKEINETSVTGKEPEVRKYYREHLWRGRKKIWICETCDRSFDDEDSVILHVLNHYPVREREKLFDKLIKEVAHE